MTEHFGFFLIDGFDLQSFAACVETLQGANDVSGGALYAWTVIGMAGAPVRSRSGIQIPVQQVAGEQVRYDALFVCCAGEALRFDKSEIFNWLRRADRFGARIAGIDCGAWVMAKAGLLEGSEAVIHWPFASALRETFGIEVELGRAFVRDRSRMTSGRGIAALELMLEEVKQNHGKDLSDAVARQMAFEPISSATADKKNMLSFRLGTKNDKLAACIDIMEQNIEEPLTKNELAGHAGISVRHLERLFAQHFGQSPAQFYRNLRLEHARRLVEQTPMQITDVAVATGFFNISHFTRAFRETFGISPSQLRRDGGATASLQSLRRLN